MSIEKTILENLVSNEEWGRKIIPFLRSEYFHNHEQRAVYEAIDEFVNEYNAFPNKSALTLTLENQRNIGDETFQQANELVQSLSFTRDQTVNEQWLTENTEKFCQQKAIFNAISHSIKIMDNSTNENVGVIPQLLSDALAVSFDTAIGHDFISDAEARFEFYHKKEERLAFDIDFFNKITKGGVPKKTLNIILGGCVHPKTKIKIRLRKRIPMMSSEIESS